MTAANNILRIIPTIQAAQLLDYNYKFSKKKKKKARDFLGVGTTNIIGGALIHAEQDFF